MYDLKVEIELQGCFEAAGEICGNSYKDARFSYLPSYLGRRGAKPISVSLPLRSEPFSPEETACYFEGLLPEGYTRRCVAGWLKADEDDYLSVLSGLGKECLGALKITERHEEEREPFYERLTREEMISFAREGALKSAQLVTKSHLSLTGASGKTGLYLNEKTGEWYLPQGTAPSTHILKQSHVRLDSIVANESLCLRTARKLGIPVPEHFIINLPEAGPDSQLFAAKRYDRIFSGNGHIIGDVIAPYRLHQEDFAQALGIPSLRKYETDGSGYLRRAFRLLRDYSAYPIQDLKRLWDITVFNYFVGNTDGHIKNLSLIYGSDLGTIRLAPAYDIISTAIYESSSDEMALSIGGEKNFHSITRGDFEEESARVGLGTRYAMKRYDDMSRAFEGALIEAGREMEEEYEGLSMKEICERILSLHNVRK